MVNKSIPVAGKNDFFSSLVGKLKGSTGLEAGDNWAENHGEGQLAVDVGQTEDKLVIVATIAGAKPEDVSITINNDMLTIRGRRETEIDLQKEDYFYRECYWGNFSRTIVLPVDVLTDEAEAVFRNGVLTVIIPKESSRKEVPIKVIED